METGDIIQIFAESGFQVDPAALDMLKTSASPELIKELLRSLDSSVIVVGAEHIRSVPAAITEKVVVRKHEDEPAKVTVLKDISNQSTCIGEYTDFVGYFKDRYTLLGE
jgi:DNA polymerase II small subunit